MTDNPYASPTDDAVISDVVSSNSTEISLASLAKSVFIAWERLRIVYIVVLGAFTLTLAIPGVLANGSHFLAFRGIVMILGGAIVANICYFAGPMIETYIRWLGHDRKWVRWFLFVGGTVLTAMLALASLASGLVPDQN